MMRRATTFLGVITLMGATLLFLLLPHTRGEDRQRGIMIMGRMVRDLSLTDLSLFPEARYTRHLAVSDTHAPFQDHPLALEHFPSGALTRPPRAR